MAARDKTNRKPKSSVARQRQLAKRQARALNFDTLEPKHLLAGVTVGNATDASNAPDTSSIAALIADDGGDGISLREAVTAANNTTGADTVQFDASVFTGGNASLIGLTGGELAITDTLTIANSNQNKVTIDAQDNSRVLNFTASSGDLTLEGLTITGGRTAEYEADFDEENAGGGIRFLSTGTLTVSSSRISGNRTAGRGNGGGVFTLSGTLSLISSTVSGNSTFGFYGSAIGGGIYTRSGTLSLTSSTVSSNYGGKGGGIFTHDGALSLTSSTVSDNNSGGEGGGIFTRSGELTLLNSTVSGNGNFGDGTPGGGIYTDSGNVSLINSMISGNITGYGVGAGTGGGGVFTSSGDLSLLNSTVSGNTVKQGPGGGISTFSGEVTLVNSTVSGNSSGGVGGGIYAQYGNVSLISSTVSSNSATGSSNYYGGMFFDASGGGIFVNNVSYYSDSNFSLENSIVSGNFSSGEGPDVGGSAPTINHSIVGGDTIFIPGTGFISIPAMLGPLAFNGGPTQTHALLPGSGAIDAGISTEQFDQRGFPRVVDLPGVTNEAGNNGVDIGAFERQTTEPIATAPVVTSFTRDEGGVLDRPDLLSKISVSFDMDVKVSADDLIFRNDTTGSVTYFNSAFTVSNNSGSTTAEWDFNDAALSLVSLENGLGIRGMMPGFYSFELLSSNIVSTADNLSVDGDGNGNPGGVYIIEPIYIALPGDANLDGKVDVLNDAFALVSNLGTTGGATWAQGDFNGDGNVDVLGDAFILVSRLGQSVVPPTPALASAEVSRSSVSSATSEVAAASEVTPTSEVAPTDPVVLVRDVSFANLAADEQDDQGRSNQPVSTSELALAGSQNLDDLFADDFWI